MSSPITHPLRRAPHGSCRGTSSDGWLGAWQRLILAALVFGLGACDADLTLPPEPDLPDPAVAEGRYDGPPILPAPSLSVLTRNVYLGGNTGLVFGADFSDPVAVTEAAATVWGQVLASDVPGRAEAIVAEIDATRPMVVSLQEVVRFASTGGTVIDWMTEIEAEIARRGLPYRTAAVQGGTAATLPVSPTELVQFTDRIAVLVHEDVEVEEIQQGRYAAELLLASAPPPIGDVVVRRGWIRLTASARRARYHVVATHLETQGIRPIHDAQAQELLGSVAAGLDGLTVIAGDLNSDAAAQPGDPSWTPTYEAALDARFTDTWLRSPRGPWAGDGFTCCQAPDLRNGPTLLKERIDFVLARFRGRRGRSWRRLPGFVRVEVVGEEQDDRLDSGLWLSDHAGLMARLRIPALGPGTP